MVLAVLVLLGCREPCVEERRAVSVFYGRDYAAGQAVVDGYRRDGWTCTAVPIREGTLIVGQTWTCTRCE